MRYIAPCLLLHLVAFCAPAFGQAGRQSGDLFCVSSLELPTHGLLAARAPRSGIVKALVLIGPRGIPSDVFFTSDDTALEREVQIAINLSRFKRSCQGRKVELVFSFELTEPATDSILPPEVRFLPPNRFELIFRRVKSNLDPASVPPSNQ